MNNNYIPHIFKEKMSSYLRYVIAFLYLTLSFITILSLISFDINDNSFLTKTDLSSNNLLGDFGSYYASFVYYTFGIFGYLFVIFFLIFSILTVIDKRPNYIFIRLIIYIYILYFIYFILNTRFNGF